MRAALGISLAGACLFAGCGGNAARTAPLPGDWPAELMLPAPAQVVAGFGPAQVRVHPLSRLEADAANPQAPTRLVLHVELTDAAGHELKWPGILRVELVGATGAEVPAGETGGAGGAGGAGGPGGERGEGGVSVIEPDPQARNDGRGRWWMDLTTPAACAQHFDGITRTYVLRLAISPGADGRSTNALLVRLGWRSAGADALLTHEAAVR